MKVASLAATFPSHAPAPVMLERSGTLELAWKGLARDLRALLDHY